MKTIFEKILAGEIPSKKVMENEHVFAIEDIAPKAPVHVLIITKRVIPDLQSLTHDDFFLLGEIVAAAQQIAEQYGIAKQGYRLLVNNGPYAGQTIHHLHFHLLGGAPLGTMA